MDFKEIYEEKTGEDPWFQDELKGTFGLTQDYVDWLEEQLSTSRVVGQSEQLKCDHQPKRYDKKHTSCEKCGKFLQMKP